MVSLSALSGEVSSFNYASDHEKDDGSWTESDDDYFLSESDSNGAGFSSLPSQQPTVQLPTCLHWVRMSSLRCHDNPALSTALLCKTTQCRAVFTYDPWFESGEKFGLSRWRFLIDSLQDLDKNLQSYGTRLHVARGQPLAKLESLCAEWNVKAITYQVDRDVDSHLLEQSVDTLAKHLGIVVAKFEGRTLYQTDALLKAHPNILSMKDFRKVLSTIGPPRRPLDPPKVPEGLQEVKPVSEELRIPTLREVGFPNELQHGNPLWIGGEFEALRKLPEYIRVRSKQTDICAQTLLDKSSLSPYIRFGCLSIRRLFWTLKETCAKDPELKQLWKVAAAKLLHREFFFTVASQIPNFDCYHNRLCLQLPWCQDADLFQIWRQGKTGYPWIDAALRQMWKEGWIHHVLRECVATFLTRGDLWLSWEKGRKVFEELLLDYESCVSSGSWMKSSGSAFISGPMEYYCPTTFGKNIDPTGEYIRTYIPELRHYPDDYIYSPWLAPPAVQVEAKCCIGIDYPNPIIDHQTTAAICSARFQSVMFLIHQFSQNKLEQTQCSS